MHIKIEKRKTDKTDISEFQMSQKMIAKTKTAV